MIPSSNSPMMAQLMAKLRLLIKRGYALQTKSSMNMPRKTKMISLKHFKQRRKQKKIYSSKGMTL